MQRRSRLEIEARLVSCNKRATIWADSLPWLSTSKVWTLTSEDFETNWICLGLNMLRKCYMTGENQFKSKVKLRTNQNKNAFLAAICALVCMSTRTLYASCLVVGLLMSFLFAFLFFSLLFCVCVFLCLYLGKELDYCTDYSIFRTVALSVTAGIKKGQCHMTLLASGL